MAGNVVKGSFKLIATLDGTTYSCVLASDKILMQYWTGSGVTDGTAWDETRGPKIWMQVTDASDNRINTQDEELIYGYSTVQFNDSANPNGWYYAKNGLPFRKQVTANGTVFQIIGNLASADNTDNDTIQVRGRIMPGNNYPIDVATPVSTIQIAVTGSGSAYTMFITGSNIYDGKDYTDVEANLYNADGGIMEVASADWKWYNMTGQEAVLIKSDSVSHAGDSLAPNKLRVSKDEVNGFELFKCSATLKEAGDVISDYIQIRDFNDPYYIDVQMKVDGVLRDDGLVAPGQTVEVAAKVTSTNGEEVVRPGQKFVPTWTLFNGKSESVADTGYRQPDGSLRFTYQEIVELGGSLDGYVTGEYVNL